MFPLWLVKRPYCFWPFMALGQRFSCCFRKVVLQPQVVSFCPWPGQCSGGDLEITLWRSPEFALFAALLFLELCFMNYGHLCFPKLQAFQLEKTTTLLASPSLTDSWKLGLGSKLGKLCGFVRLFPLSEIIVILYSHCPTFENHYIIYIVLISLLV